MIHQNTPLREDADWLDYLTNSLTDPNQLLDALQLPRDDYREAVQARKLFPFRVPLTFVKKMEVGNPNDPLFLQVMSSQKEFEQVVGFSTDPLEEQNNTVPGLLHKYHNRVLLLVKGGCAINCRYCFRRHFPYSDNKGSKANWQKAIDYISQHSEIDEIILSGGDPLMAKDHELAWLLTQLEQIPHIKNLRIHSRLPVSIPQRINSTLCAMLKASPFNIVLVNHINHANEIDRSFQQAMSQLRDAGVVLLNQSVLLKGINDNPLTLKTLSQKLLECGILPYYLFMLDKVQGAAHFHIADNDALKIYQELQKISSGYLVPRLAKEIAGEPNKTIYVLNDKC